jgi:hypothetical protein
MNEEGELKKAYWYISFAILHLWDKGEYLERNLIITAILFVVTIFSCYRVLNRAFNKDIE